MNFNDFSLRCILLLTVINVTKVNADEGSLNQLKKLSLNELSNIEISVATKIPQRLFDTPGAAFVITKEDIKRSAATRLPDLLRMVPGFNVSHIDNNVWAVSSRGFASRFSNKLLVSIDGRTIYSPLFSGVFWEMQDIILSNVERIEVIRGPGGANTVDLTYRLMFLIEIEPVMHLILLGPAVVFVEVPAIVLLC